MTSKSNYSNSKRKNYSGKFTKMGVEAAKRYHFCRNCKHNQPETYVECPQCGSKDRVFFPSKTELHRGALLLTLEAAGKITKLSFHPRFDLKVNGIKVAVYTADAHYYNHDGAYVVEDSKPEKFLTDTAKIKIRLFQAIYGITVNIPQKKERN